MTGFHENVNYLHWHAFPDTLALIGLAVMGWALVMFVKANDGGDDES